MVRYRERVADHLLNLKLQSFPAVLITGPKGCGKTTTAKQKARSVVEFQDEDRRDEYLAVANTQPSRLLIGNKPRLFDEWQDAPKIWGAVRKAADDDQENGSYILTGSSSRSVETAHTGTQRISTLRMYPMSLFESGESNGSVSIGELFLHPRSFSGCRSGLSMDELIFSICRGGWPRAVNNRTAASKLEVARDLFRQICERDASNIDGVNRNPLWLETILRSYARNLCTLSKKNTVYQDVSSTTSIAVSTFDDYVSALEKLYIVEDVDAWSPAIRSKSAIRASRKRNLIDPSIAAAALGIGPEYFNEDFKTLGFLFESLCIRDLRIYSASRNGRLSYYSDRYGLEADAVLHLENGQYALIEVKLGSAQVDEAAAHLNEIERLIEARNDRYKQSPMRMPQLKIVLTATEYGYQREDGVLVIPIGCLRD